MSSFLEFFFGNPVFSNFSDRYGLRKIAVKSWFPQPGSFIIGPIFLKLRMEIIIYFFFNLVFSFFFGHYGLRKFSVESWLPQPGAFIIGPILLKLHIDVH